MTEIRVLIVDDQLPFRLAARAVVSRAEGFCVVGEVEDGDLVAQASEELGPDLVLMDVKMARLDGIEATRRLRAAMPDVVVVLCSTYPLAELPDHAVDCGAAGYLRKEQLSADTLRSLWNRRDEHGFVTV